MFGVSTTIRVRNRVRGFGLGARLGQVIVKLGGFLLKDKTLAAWLCTSLNRGLFPTPPPSQSNIHYIRIFSLVSGSLRATTPPHTSAEKDSRMGMILVMPTNEAKMELPKMAASLQRALRTPNAVALKSK